MGERKDFVGVLSYKVTREGKGKKKRTKMAITQIMAKKSSVRSVA